MSGWPPAANFVLALVLAPAASFGCCGVYRLLGGRPIGVFTGWFSGCAAGGISAVFDHAWAFASGSAVSMAIGLALWWWRRRKRRNVLALMGNKGRARIAAMRQAMRERAKPRPVLRPQRSPA